MRNITFNQKYWFLIGIQIAVIVGFYLMAHFHLEFGEKVLLKILPPPDPLSLFQGHYLVLNYEISLLKNGEYSFVSKKYSSPSQIHNYETVFIVLEKRGSFFQAKEVSTELPKKRPFIEGTVMKNRNGDLEIRYGIEDYFIPEKNFTKIEQKFRDYLRQRKEIFAEISLNKFGKPLLRKIIVEKEAINLEDSENNFLIR
jgi:uncharacterized membrane-anchored protein